MRLNEERIKRIKSRLELLYAAEIKALEMQSVSNKEGELQTVASLSTIQGSISKLETELDALQVSERGNVIMFWDLQL